MVARGTEFRDGSSQGKGGGKHGGHGYTERSPSPPERGSRLAPSGCSFIGDFIPHRAGSNILLASGGKNMLPVYGNMIETPSKPAEPVARSGKIFRRVRNFLIAAVCVGFLMRYMSGRIEHSTTPAGFARGVLQGALMPCAFPNLLVGNDVIIYAPNNTG